METDLTVTASFKRIGEAVIGIANPEGVWDEDPDVMNNRWAEELNLSTETADSSKEENRFKVWQQTWLADSVYGWCNWRTKCYNSQLNANEWA